MKSEILALSYVPPKCESIRSPTRNVLIFTLPSPPPNILEALPSIHNPLLYARARDMAGRVAQAMKQASREATILVRPGIGPAPGSHGRTRRPGLLLL